MPTQYLKDTTVEGHIRTCVYQTQLLHQEFQQPLNVVIIAKTNLRTQARAHVVLFCSDLELAYTLLVDYYGLRFQIEFNFRDAKQYWGLEDFMNVTPTGVTNAANLSLFMVNVAYRLRADSHPRDPAYSVLDLKADCRGYKYVQETIKMLPEKPVVLENSNVAKLASTLYLSVHSLPQEDCYDTDDASARKIYPILVPESTL